MIIPDAKKAMMTIMAKRGPKGEDKSQPTPMKNEVAKDADGEMDGRHAAMQDFMAAHAESSPLKMMEAMANFVDLHLSKKSE